VLGSSLNIRFQPSWPVSVVRLRSNDGPADVARVSTPLEICALLPGEKCAVVVEWGA
jgi:hypothetical protein